MSNAAGRAVGQQAPAELWELGPTADTLPLALSTAHHHCPVLYLGWVVKTRQDTQDRPSQVVPQILCAWRLGRRGPHAHSTTGPCLHTPQRERHAGKVTQCEHSASPRAPAHDKEPGSPMSALPCDLPRWLSAASGHCHPGHCALSVHKALAHSIILGAEQALPTPVGAAQPHLAQELTSQQVKKDSSSMLREPMGRPRAPPP